MSFDVSVVDIAMLIAIIVLFALYVTSTSKETPFQKRTLKKTRVYGEVVKKPSLQRMNDNSVEEKLDCPHHLGYLKTRKDKSVPEECVGCPKLVRCLLSEE